MSEQTVTTEEQKPEVKSSKLSIYVGIGIICIALLFALVSYVSSHLHAKESGGSGADKMLFPTPSAPKFRTAQEIQPTKIAQDDQKQQEDKAKEAAMAALLKRMSAPLNAGGVGETSSNTANRGENAASGQRAQGVAQAQSGNSLAGNDPNTSFLNRASNASVATSYATELSHPKFTLIQGTVIPAVLNTAINSDMPGMVTASVARDVYGYQGSMVLIPKGSKIIGQYSSTTTQGQTRVFVVYTRIVRPDGISIMIDSPGADALGRSGMPADDVDTHFWERTGNAILYSIIGTSASTTGVSSSDQYNSASAYRTGVAQAFANQAQQALQSGAIIKPTLSVYQGAQINILLAKDLSFYNVLTRGMDT